ncbi:hypothetical protein [Alkalihalobacillus trypoxylicola]|uniref:hypothetical protein n=1 Tax=Alkalihalobacillus trypoxylicola TaxID=519424 RepID=UPI000B2B5197|nr:hypothetical protein [Alkalihalobacillus trypoxylicola]
MKVEVDSWKWDEGICYRTKVREGSKKQPLLSTEMRAQAVGSGQKERSIRP